MPNEIDIALAQARSILYGTNRPMSDWDPFDLIDCDPSNPYPEDVHHEVIKEN
jgi:hypothetical protein